jgi:hypothetical protein
MKKKRHHYVPKAYLKYFCNEEGKVYVYLKDDPGKIIHQLPDNTAFHKYYYSQPLSEGGKDHNALENIFSELEAKWPPIMERIRRRENVNDKLEDIFAFMSLQRVRVPACRDATEKLLAETVKATGQHLKAAGKLPPMPKGFEDILDRAGVAIDPHQSILAMIDMIKGVGQVFDRIGIRAIQNMTEIPFLTSDNPVIWFDPSVPEDEMKPYALQAEGPVAFLFPVSPDIMIYGCSSDREAFAYDGLDYAELSEPSLVEMMNRQVSRFAYKAVFSKKTGQEALIKEYADKSPILKTEVISTEKGKFVLHHNIFGKREDKIKWVD